VNVLRKQQRPEGNTTSPNRSSIARKANAANSSRQKQANANRSRQTQADNAKKKNSA
jgi:hypothetical protein